MVRSLGESKPERYIYHLSLKYESTIETKKNYPGSRLNPFIYAKNCPSVCCTFATDSFEPKQTEL